MARIGGQELNFGAGVEGFLTKFAEGRANAVSYTHLRAHET